MVALRQLPFASLDGRDAFQTHVRVCLPHLQRRLLCAAPPARRASAFRFLTRPFAPPLPTLAGEQWSYLRGGLTTIDRDFGIFNKIHHDIGTHVVHHLFPQIPHYNLCEATEAVKPVMGPYYREPAKSPSWCVRARCGIVWCRVLSGAMPQGSCAGSHASAQQLQLFGAQHCLAACCEPSC